MVLLNFIRALFLALATYVILALTFGGQQWHWINYAVMLGIWFLTGVATDFAEDFVIRKFNPEDDTFRG